MIEEKLDVGVIGLGKFGLELALTLSELGHNVVGLDAHEERVRMAQDDLATVYRGNATDITVLRQLRFEDLDPVIVSVGDSMEDSLLIVLALQELNVRNIHVKANSLEYQKILNRLGVNHVIMPQHEIAVQFAHRLGTPGMLDVLPLGEGVLVRELTVEAWDGKSLNDLSLPTKYRVIVLALRGKGAQHYHFVPAPDQPLSAGDRMVVLGQIEHVLKLNP